MQTSLFTPEGKTAMYSRLAALRTDSPRGWGRMTPAQMLAHCQAPLGAAIGRNQLRGNFLVRLLGPFIKKQLLRDAGPLKQNLPTDKTFLVKDERDFEKERATLLDMLDEFSAKGPAGRLEPRHPFFGPMTAEEWNLLHHKHLDHHLRQFGV